MKTNLLQKISVKLVAAFISIALLITGVCYIGIEGNVVQAATLETAVTANGEGYYVKDYTGAEFNAYKNEGTYPKMVTEKDDDVQEWLFAGWYQEKDDTNGTCKKAYDSATTAVGEDATVYAKFVPASVMAVKCQVTPGTDVDSEKANMRLISTTDSADYTRMGFHVVYRGKLIDCYTTTLYKRVAASDDGMECNYSANAFDTASNYFFAVRLTNIENANFAEPFYIESYWVTADGTTVTGVSRYARVEDSYKKIVNIPVRLYSDEQVTNGEVSLSYNATQFELYGLDGTTKKYGVAGETKIAETVFDNVTYTEPVVDTENMATIILTGSNTAVDEDTPAVTAHGIFANVRLQLKEGQLIESNTSFKVADETFTNKNSESSSVTLDVANVIYKNYTMDYTGGSDTSWYDEFAEEDTFVISTAADLYGLAKIVNDTTTELYKNEQFSGKTIKLGADITINTSALAPDEYEEAEEGAWDSVIASAHKWTPIGNAPDNTSTLAFAGTFDGLGNVIKGICITNDTDMGVGLFGLTATESSLTNFELRNSYIQSNQHRTGSIVGEMRGNISGVYSDATIDISAANEQLGGLIGLVRYTNENAQQVMRIDNCCFDGKINTNVAAHTIGGIAGATWKKTIANASLSIVPKVVFENCKFTGKINHTLATTGNRYLGGIVGRDNISEFDHYIINCLSAGTIEVTSGTYVGSILGAPRSGTYSIEDCYATSSLVGTGTSTKVVGTVEYTLSNMDENETEENILNAMEVTTTEIEGPDSYINATCLGYASRQNKDATWVITEEGTPELKSFCDEWIDVAWYYDSVSDESDIFVIYTPEELYGFSALSQDINFSGDTVTLGADIEMNTGKATSWYAGKTTPKRAFTPIGQGTVFKGIFDGKYNGEIHTISGIYVNSSEAYTGLFGRINNSTLMNFKLNNSYVINSGSTDHTAGVVGRTEDGTLSNIYCEAIITSAGGVYTGGIAGATNGTENSISSCWFNGTVAAKGRWAAGLVGRVSAGQVTVENCISEGRVSSDSTDTKGANAGGLFGSVTADNASSAIVKNTLSLCEVTAETGVGAIVGGINQQVEFENVYTIYDIGSAITGVAKISDKVNGNEEDESVKGEPILLTEAEVTDENAYIYTDFDFDNTWGVVAEGTPVLRTLYEGTVETDLTAQRISTNWYYNNTQYDSTLTNSTKSFEVQDVNDFFGLARLVNGAKVNDGFAGKTVQLVKDGDFNLSPNGDYTVTADETCKVTHDSTKTSPWNPIGTETNPFKGTFDGNGNTISSMFVKTTASYAGLFGNASNATFKNFRLENSYILQGGKHNYIAGIVGYATDSVLESIYCNVSLNVTQGQSYEGCAGLVGYYDSSADASNTEAQISDCWYEGTIWAYGRFVGGLIGRVNKGMLKMADCISAGRINSINAKTSSSVYVGGIVGAVNSATKQDVSLTMENCLHSGTVLATETNLDVSDDDSVGTVLGKAYNGNATFKNVYTTSSLGESNEPIKGIGNQSNSNYIISGQPKLLSSQELSDENAYYVHTDLDFYNEDNKDGVWGLTEEGVPVLKDLYTGNLKENINSDRICTGWYYNNASYDKSMVDSNVDYSIATAGDLRGLAKLVNEGTETFGATAGKGQSTIILTKDIVVNDGVATEWAEGKTEGLTSWTPIGTVDVSDGNGSRVSGTEIPFQGVFDGANYIISGLYMTTTDSCTGLFGYVNNATIQNLKIQNSYFENTKQQGDAFMGSVVGYVGSSNNVTMKNVYSDAYISSSSRHIGGLVGFTRTGSANEISLESCWFDGDIDVVYNKEGSIYVGGLLGYVYTGNAVYDTCLYTGDISVNYTCNSTQANWGSYIGGFSAGDRNDYASNQITHSLCAGSIDITWNKNTNDIADAQKTVAYANQLIGRANDADSKVKNTYSTTIVTERVLNNLPEKVLTTSADDMYASANANNYDIQYLDKANEGNLYGLGAQVATNLAFKAEDRIAADSEITGTEVTVAGPIWAAVAGQLPVPATLADHALDVTSVGKIDKELAGEGTETKPYLITTVEELYGFAQLSQSDNYEGDYISLGADILIYDELPWICQISTNTDNIRFAGTFDGQNPETGEIHTISGINAKMNASRLGLFAATEVGSTVKNLRLTDSYFEQTGDGIVGSIAAECRGAIDNVYSDATIVTSAEEAGGIIARANGYNKATDGDDETESGFTDKRISSSITNCWFDGTITSDKQYVGGIIASTRQGAWTMSNCLFTGTIYDNYTGSENAYIGGLCGEIQAQSIALGSGSEILTSLDVQSCISTGTIHTTVLEKGIGSVVGRLSAGVAIVNDVPYYNYTSLNMENVFVTRDAGSKVTGSIGSASNDGYSTEAKVIGYATQINNADRLIGYCTEEAVKDRTKTYKAATLDFTSESPSWILRTDGVPVPATFADMVNKVEDYQLLNSEIGLTYLNEILNKTGDNVLSIEKAVNQGVGNYVLNVEGVTLDTYKKYLTKLKSEELGFEVYVDVDFENLVGTADDGVYNAIYTHKIADTEQVDWILNVLYVDSTNTKTMSITITSDESTLSPNLVAPTETTSTDEGITFAMLQLDGNDVTLAGTLLYTYGSSYVFQLPDGDFIINDGGSVSGNDFNGLITFLAELAGAEITATDENGVVTALNKDINIEAWTVSHQHNDHIGVVRQFMVQEIAKQIHVEAFYISEPNNRAIHIEDFTASSEDATFFYQELEMEYQGMRMLTKSDKKTAPDIYRYQTGQRYYFDGITMDVIQSQEIIPVGNYGKRKAGADLATDYNTASGTLLYTIQDGGQKILISGDANHKNMEYIMEMYGSTDGYTDAELLRGIDVFTALHHGKNSSYTIESEEGYKTYTDYFLQANETFAVTLFPCSVYYGDKVGLYNTDYAGAFPYAKDANDYLKSKSTNSYNYGNGNVVFTLKTDGTIDKQ